MKDALFGFKTAVYGADHARGHCVGKPERIADCNHGFAYHQVIGVSHFNGRKRLLGFNLEHRQIRFRVSAHNSGGKLPAVL